MQEKSDILLTLLMMLIINILLIISLFFPVNQYKPHVSFAGIVLTKEQHLQLSLDCLFSLG